MTWRQRTQSSLLKQMAGTQEQLLQNLARKSDGNAVNHIPGTPSLAIVLKALDVQSVLGEMFF
jgi:hypothetical protein